LAEAVRKNAVFYVYVLRSLKNSKRYIGYTAKAPADQLKEHNGGATSWTRHNRPFVLLHHELFGDSKSARERERFLKSGKGRQWLDELIGK
jgi:putative endonuclease